LPGTVIEANEGSCRQLISSLFQTGGLVLSQVCTITGLETHTVQNWVKRKFVSPPVDKKYSQRQFCRIVTMNMLKDVLPLPSITSLLFYINGAPDGGSDGLIDDSELYFYFNDVLLKTGDDLSAIDDKIKRALARYAEPRAGGKARLSSALKIMVTAYIAGEQKKKALLYIKEIGN